jgi:hypothetical protein
MRRSRLTTAAFLGLPLLLGLVVRLWGIGFAPTSPRARPDEDIFIQRAFASIIESPGIETLRSGWPEGFFRVQYYLLRLEQGVLGLIGGHPVNLGCLYALNPGAVELPARLFSAFCDLLTCVLVGLMVRRLAPPRVRPYALAVGILAYACNYLAVRDAHFGVSDATLLLGVALTLYFALRAVLDDPRFLVVAGAAAGVAFGIKYSAAALVVPCLVAVAGAILRFPRKGRTLAIAGIAVGAALLALGLTSPTLAAHPGELLRSLLAHRTRYDSSVLEQTMDRNWVPVPGWRFYLLEDLPAAFGIPGLILATVGLGLLVVENPWPGAILIGSSLATLSTFVGLQMLFTRYAAPMLPPLAVGLGFLLLRLFEQLLERAPRGLAWLTFALLLALAMGPPLLTSLQFDRLLARPSTYDVASRWLLKQGPNRHAVAQGWYAQVQLLDPVSEEACAAELPAWLNPGVPTMPEVGSNWPAAIEAGEIGWVFIAEEAVNKYVFDLAGWERADYVAVGRIALPCDRPAGPLEEHLPLDDGCFEVAAVISPGNLPCSSTMDVFDYFPAPFTGFAGWRMLGPRIEILKNICKP